MHKRRFDVADPQRTHKATPKRIREFRKRGEIALSRDVVSAATLTGGFLGMVACAALARGALFDLTRGAALASDGSDATAVAHAALRGFVVAAGPAMLGAAIGAVVAIVPQLGWPPAFKLPGFDLSRISPHKNLPSTFALSGMVRRSGAAITKLVLVGAIVGAALRHHVATFTLEAGGLGAMAWNLARRALWPVLGVLGALAAVDYLLARRRMAAQMRMSADEVKREHREQEGDPAIRGRRKQRMRELARRRIAAAVATADVVVVNPTHYAVALRYDDKRDAAPVVVAKGTDEQAEKIREIARGKSIPVLSRPPLARALYKHVKEGRAVPANLYRAVAEVLAYVYRLRQRGSR
ncbi:MAG TPA: EscU/YscU/HrcU family type III secretion system export apparatus switch protein [Kofleriaceae bacterium]|nr:EscU/YscU/HrcU family type III secretion system export apparatus switch protein [Kofleriaceae bacterium]